MTGEMPESPNALIVSESVDAIIAHVLEAELPARKRHQLSDPDSMYGIATQRVWIGAEPPSYITSPFQDPKYITSANPADYPGFQEFQSAMLEEYTAREFESLYWRTYGELFGQVINPDDFITLVDVFDYLYRHSVHAEDNIKPPEVAGKIIHRSTDIVTDPSDGSANPDDIASLALPPIVHLLDIQSAIESPDLAGTIARQLSAALLRISAEGTADRVASLRIRDRLHELGYPNFGENRNSTRQRHSTGERYISRSALILISHFTLGFQKGLPASGSEALQTIQSTILNFVQDQANGGNVIAEQLIGAFERLSPGKGFQVKGVPAARDLPFGTIIHVANELTKQLNHYEGLVGDQLLPQLDTSDLTELPIAFQRILYAMDPALLRVAASDEIPLRQAPNLRKQMVYIEALSGQWRDLTRVPGPTVGDYVLRMQSLGWKPDTIRRHLEDLEHRSPDPASSKLAAISKDPRTNRSHVAAERQRSGYGYIS